MYFDHTKFFQLFTIYKVHTKSANIDCVFFFPGNFATIFFSCLRFSNNFPFNVIFFILGQLYQFLSHLIGRLTNFYRRFYPIPDQVHCHLLLVLTFIFPMHSLVTLFADRSTLAKYVMIMKPAKFDTEGGASFAFFPSPSRYRRKFPKVT